MSCTARFLHKLDELARLSVLTFLFVIVLLLLLLLQLVLHHLLEEEISCVVLIHLQLHPCQWLLLLSLHLWTWNSLVEQFDQHGEILREVRCERLSKLHISEVHRVT